MNYAERITWLRQTLKTEVELQLQEKQQLRQPHDEKAAYLQGQCDTRRFTITALLILLSTERHQLKGTQPEHSHHYQDKYEAHRLEFHLNKQRRELDKVCPYPKLYVVVDASLTTIQKGIQGAHAVAELLKQYGVLDHSALVFLQHERLYEVLGQLQQEKVKCAGFREPDLKDKLTAVAVEPLELEQRPTLLSELPLAS